MSSDSAGSPSWRINEVSTEVVITEPVGALSAADVKKIASLVLEHLRHEQDRTAERERDTNVRDRAYRSDVE